MVAKYVFLKCGSGGDKRIFCNIIDAEIDQYNPQFKLSTSRMAATRGVL